MTDITVDGAMPAKTLGKDGKEYTGKKRGRKSAADKLREADEALGATDSATLQAIALAVENTPKDKKKKDKKEAAPKATVVRLPFRVFALLCGRPCFRNAVLLLFADCLLSCALSDSQPIVSVPITKAPKTPKSASKVAAAPAVCPTFPRLSPPNDDLTLSYSLPFFSSRPRNLTMMTRTKIPMRTIRRSRTKTRTRTRRLLPLARPPSRTRGRARTRWRSPSRRSPRQLERGGVLGLLGCFKKRVVLASVQGERRTRKPASN